MMDILQILTEADYDLALAEVEQCFLSEPAQGTDAADRFNVLASSIEAYEANNWAIRGSAR